MNVPQQPGESPVSKQLSGGPVEEQSAYMRLRPIPSFVTSSPTTHDLDQLFPLPWLDRDLPSQVLCLRVKWDENLERLSNEVERKLTDSNGDGRLLYTGLWSRNTLVSMMGYFGQSTSGPYLYLDNDFGPGVYTTPSMNSALRHAAPKGALLVFKDADFRHLNHWLLNEHDWTVVISYWRGISRFNPEQQGVPDGWNGADIIEGRISTGPHHTPGSDVQVAATSVKGSRALAAALEMIIWFE